MGTVKNISGWWGSVILGFCVVLLLSGCSFGKLREDLQEIGQLKLISGRIVGAEENPEKPLVSVLWSVDEEEDQLSGYWVVQPSGEFLFGRASGRYYLFAFEDSNEDFDYQDNEKIAVYGSPTLIDLNSTKNYENLLLELKPKDEIAVPDGLEDLADEEIEKNFPGGKIRLVS